MKKELIVLFTLSLLFLTGCIGDGIPSYQIVEDQNYVEDDYFNGLSLRIPEFVNTQDGIYITIIPTRPNGSSYGSYGASYYPPVPDVCFISTKGNIVLYYPGLWRVEYTIYEHVEERRKVSEGTHLFWVDDKEHDLDRYELEFYNKTANGITFRLRNTGRAAGYVNVLVYASNAVQSGEISVYGKIYYDRKINLNPGHYHDTTVIVPDSNAILKVRLNEKIYGIE